MKLRLRGSSIRLRLSRAEVAAVARGERVEEATAFAPGAVLRCLLETGAVEAPSARLDGACITVVLPAGATRRWAASDDEVGIAGAQPVGEGGATLAIVVEKDFPCAGRPAAENAGTFDPPPGAPRC